MNRHLRNQSAFAATLLGLAGLGPAALAGGEVQFRGLGTLPGERSSSAAAVSGDGATITGQSGTDAYRWTAAGGMERLPYLVPGEFAQGMSVSYDGSFIAGTIVSGGGGRAVRWSAGGGDLLYMYTPDTGRIPD